MPPLMSLQKRESFARMFGALLEGSEPLLLRFSTWETSLVIQKFNFLLSANVQDVRFAANLGF